MGSGRGSGKGDCDSVVVCTCVWVGVGIFLQVLKLILGLVYWNDCQANRAIPIYLTGSAGGETGLDKYIIIIITTLCVTSSTTQFFLKVAVEHFIGIIVGSIVVFSDYSYLVGGCDGAKECCDKHLIKFALGVSIIEWILIIIPVFVLICIHVFAN